MTTNETLCTAIRARRVVTFNYEGHSRTIEPYVIYPDAEANWLLEGWQISGYTSRPADDPWRRYKIQGITSLVVLSETFTGTRDKYIRDSKRYENSPCKH